MRKLKINSAGNNLITRSVSALLIPLAIVSVFLLFKPLSASAEEMADITASHLKYFARDNTYIAEGSVKIRFKDSTLFADMVRLDSDTSDAVAAGNVVYEDREAVITADRIELNLKTKLGTIYNGYIFYKNQNFHLHAGNIKKIGRKTFFLDRATVTTCDAEPPAWHISGKDITIRRNRSLTAWNTTFNIKNIPVIYTPFFWAPLNR
ncbi:MAG: LPS-assembly protein LptD, partial [Deferribacteres bacterium]|nr:LPS-assembly protein LptD [Deferribacteres bacterium]